MSQGKSSSTYFWFMAVSGISPFMLLLIRSYFSLTETQWLCVGFLWLQSLLNSFIIYNSLEDVFLGTFRPIIMAGGLLLFTLYILCLSQVVITSISNTMPRRTTLKSLLGFRGEGFCSSQCDSSVSEGVCGYSRHAPRRETMTVY